MGKVLITDTILRDAHQSQAATRMRLEEICLLYTSPSPRDTT